MSMTGQCTRPCSATFCERARGECGLLCVERNGRVIGFLKTRAQRTSAGDPGVLLVMRKRSCVALRRTRDCRRVEGQTRGPSPDFAGTRDDKAESCGWRASSAV